MFFRRPSKRPTGSWCSNGTPTSTRRTAPRRSISVGRPQDDFHPKIGVRWKFTLWKAYKKRTGSHGPVEILDFPSYKMVILGWLHDVAWWWMGYGMSAAKLLRKDDPCGRLSLTVHCTAKVSVAWFLITLIPWLCQNSELEHGHLVRWFTY